MSFEILKKYMHFFGVLQQGSNDKTLRIVYMCYNVVVLIVYFLLNGYYFMFVAQTFADYSASSFYLLCSILVLWWHIVYLIERKNFSQIVDDLEQIIERSKSSTRFSLPLFFFKSIFLVKI